MLLTGLQPVFKVHGQNDGVCMRHYLISSSKILECGSSLKLMMLQLLNEITLNTHCTKYKLWFIYLNDEYYGNG